MTNKLDEFLPAAITNTALQAGLPKSSLPALMKDISTTEFSHVPGISPPIIAAVGAAEGSAAVRAFQYVWYAVITFSCVALLASYMTIDYGAYLNNVVERNMRHGAWCEGNDRNEEVEAAV